MSVLFQVALDGFALVFEVRRGDREIHRLTTSRHFRWPLAGLQHLEQAAHVVREIIEFEPEIPLRLRPEDFVQLAHSAGLGVHFEELVSEQRLQRRRMLIGRHRGLQHLEDTGLVPDPEAALLRRRLAERVDFLSSPFRPDVPGGHDRHERRNLLQALDERDRKVVVPLELGVPPDSGVPPEQLPEARLERPLQIRHPPLVPLDQLDIVEVGIADERIPVKMLGHDNVGSRILAAESAIRSSARGGRAVEVLRDGVGEPHALRIDLVGRRLPGRALDHRPPHLLGQPDLWRVIADFHRED